MLRRMNYILLYQANIDDFYCDISDSEDERVAIDTPTNQWMTLQKSGSSYKDLAGSNKTFTRVYFAVHLGSDNSSNDERDCRSDH